MSDYKCPYGKKEGDEWDGVERRMAQWDGIERRLDNIFQSKFYNMSSGSGTSGHAPNVIQNGRLSLELKDIFTVLLILGGLIGTWVALNNDLTTEKLKVQQVEKDLVEIKQDYTSVEKLLQEQDKRNQDSIQDLKSQIRDLEVSVNNVYQKVSSWKK
ncbi:MAG: hypothetical protein QXN55_00365 [Candidatus Nitrosotenuis sp.]